MKKKKSGKKERRREGRRKKEREKAYRKAHKNVPDNHRYQIRDESETSSYTGYNTGFLKHLLYLELGRNPLLIQKWPPSAQLQHNKWDTELANHKVTTI